MIENNKLIKNIIIIISIVLFLIVLIWVVYYFISKDKQSNNDTDSQLSQSNMIIIDGDKEMNSDKVLDKIYGLTIIQDTETPVTESVIEDIEESDRLYNSVKNKVLKNKIHLNFIEIFNTTDRNVTCSYDYFEDFDSNFIRLNNLEYGSVTVDLLKYNGIKYIVLNNDKIYSIYHDNTVDNYYKSIINIKTILLGNLIDTKEVMIGQDSYCRFCLEVNDEETNSGLKYYIYSDVDNNIKFILKIYETGYLMYYINDLNKNFDNDIFKIKSDYTEVDFNTLMNRTK